MQSKSLILVVASAVVLALPVAAHHSHINYEPKEFTQLEGTVAEIHLLNPHSWVYIEVKEQGGQTRLWALEATGPGGLERRGVKPGDVRVGDAVKVRCHRLRDGSPGCLLGFLTPMHGDAARGHGVERLWD
jgi:hypothetical protein